MLRVMMVVRMRRSRMMEKLKMMIKILISALSPQKHFSKRRERYWALSKRDSRQKRPQSETDWVYSCGSPKWLRNFMCATFTLQTVATISKLAGCWMISALILLFRIRSCLQFNLQLWNKLPHRVSTPLTTFTVSKRESDIIFTLLIRQLILCMICPCPYN